MGVDHHKAHIQITFNNDNNDFCLCVNVLIMFILYNIDWQEDDDAKM